MNFDYFTKAMLCKVQLFLGGDYEASLHEVKKNNGVELVGIMARRKGESACPTFYLDDFYEPEMTDNDVEYLAVSIANRIKNAKMSPTMNVDVLNEFTLAKDGLTLKLINADRNKEFLLDIPHRRFHNLAVIYCYVVPDLEYGGQASVTITNSIMKEWDVDESTLFDTAYKNYKNLNPGIITPMRDAIGRSAADELPEVDLQMYVISNAKRVWGAVAVLDNEILDRMAGMLDSGFFILPSSIHEIIVVKIDGEFAKESQRLLDMVTEVNGEMVDEQEYLADSVYYYDRGEGEVMWVC